LPRGRQLFHDGFAGIRNRGSAESADRGDRRKQRQYGSIRMHQEIHFPGRPSGTMLLNADFALLAQSYGAHGEATKRHEDFPAAFERAVKANKPAIIELRVNRNQLTPDRVL
jgi:thiamine pyrophosphate-dependent acetolactate synthase large subunit-like protein